MISVTGSLTVACAAKQLEYCASNRQANWNITSTVGGSSSWWSVFIEHGRGRPRTDPRARPAGRTQAERHNSSSTRRLSPQNVVIIAPWRRQRQRQTDLRPPRTAVEVARRPPTDNLRPGRRRRRSPTRHANTAAAAAAPTGLRTASVFGAAVALSACRDVLHRRWSTASIKHVAPPAGRHTPRVVRWHWAVASPAQGYRVSK